MKYKVKVLRVQGFNNKTFKAGEIVTDSNFPEGNAAILVKEGKLEEIKEVKKVVVEEKKEIKEEVIKSEIVDKFKKAKSE